MSLDRRLQLWAIMMKQPAENTNAYPADEAKARERQGPVSLDSPAVKEEISALAHEYYRARAGSGDVPGQEDWSRAEACVRNRILATQTG